jgi:DNA-binding LacI/PurR family transcriptional regulator
MIQDSAVATRMLPQSLQKLKSIDDIAKIANVSKSTVSRALNDSPLVNQSTKDKIVAIAKSHGFQCCSQARNLSTRTSKVIGFVNHAYCGDWNGISDPFSLEIMGGITVGVYEMGYELMVIHVDPRDEGWVSKYLDSRKVDGFILMTSTRKRSHMDMLLRLGAPFIAWGMENKGFCTVLGDNLRGGQLAAGRFVETGRKRPACIYGPREEIEAEERQKGFERAMNGAGIAIDTRLVRFGDYGEEAGEGRRVPHRHGHTFRLAFRGQRHDGYRRDTRLQIARDRRPQGRCRHRIRQPERLLLRQSGPHHRQPIRLARRQAPCPRPHHLS